MFREIVKSKEVEQEEMREITGGMPQHGPCHCSNCGDSGNDATHANMTNV